MYTFKNTEKNNKKANDYETKALLYLLSYRTDSSSIDTFAIDCFNDVTGCNNHFSKLWDLQSKNVKDIQPKKLGTFLITLFLNHEHTFPFKNFILFIPKLKESYLIEKDKKTFDISNFKIECIEKIRLGLTEEYKRRENKEINAERRDLFLTRVFFVLGDTSEVEYVKKITNFKHSIVQDDFFKNIFKEIRDKQTSLKNICVENISINEPSDVLTTNKIIKRTEFDSLIINRFIGYDIFKDLNLFPNSFFDEIKNYDEEERKDIIQNSKSEISRLLFDKNNKKKFWKFFEIVLCSTKQDLSKKPREVYNNLLLKNLKIPSELSDITVIYLISLIKDGWKNEE